MTSNLKQKPIVSICYDFDGTLVPGNMQEHNFIPELNINSPDFWNEVEQRGKEEDADGILTYMKMMLEKAEQSREVKFTRQAFSEYGKKLKLFRGVNGWFDRITKHGQDAGVAVEHYIISSGLREMIEGSSIAGKFKKIYASSYMYDQNNVAIWPALGVNYTTKTQFLFRINKGQHEVWDDSKINEFVPHSERPVPFERMIFIGDGTTDVPCMRLVKDMGGYPVAVYEPSSSDKGAKELLDDGRVLYIAPADYSEGRQLDQQIKRVIDMMAAEAAVQLERSLRSV